MIVDILLKPNIIYKDRDFLVFAKPSGLLVHQTKYQKENTLVDWLLKHFPELKSIGPKERPGIVHRLDRDVSGLMVVARTNEAFKHLIKQFKTGRVKKEYLALVYGKAPQEKGEIDLPIGRTRKGKLVAIRSRKKIKLEKEAMTEYEVIQKLSRFTLLKAMPLTGRTHQIRLHFKSIGCPIVGDRRYSKNGNEKDSLARIFLHAVYLGFYDLNNQWREFSSELPVKLNNFLKNIKGGEYG